MTIASLVLAHCRFLPATDGVDFREATIETTRKYAAQWVGYTLNEIVELLAIWKYDRDMQKAWVALECLYFGKNITTELFELHLRRLRQYVQLDALKQRRELEKEIESEIEKLNRKEVA